ncbi:MAG: family 16 glycosylhydrolase [Bacteroidales bacterium]
MNKKNKLSGSFAAAILILFLSALSISSCEKDSERSFTADFSYEFKDDNNVEFKNESTGEYYSLTWDFGIGEEETTTDKNRNFQIYYPNAGEYEVILKILDYSGNTKMAEKTITIEVTDLLVSFTAEIDPSSPNLVNLTNTTEGEYDSFIWTYRNKEVKDEDKITAYFPFAGNYEIELEVQKDDNIFTETQNVSISQDDPGYIENFTLVWSDEFDGPEISTSNWTFETGASGWGNNELQNYTNGDNAEIVDGKLIITARKVNEDKSLGSYTSARLITENKQEFQYGRMEIRAKLPSGTGVWPAIWMLGSDFRVVGWPESGEMDIMEYVGYQPNTIHSTVHTPSGFAGEGSGSSKILETCEEEFHIYGMLWTEQELVFYTDTPDNITHRYAPSTKNDNTWPFDQPAFFILNLAIGGDWGGLQGIDNSIFPQQLEIDYVRVFQESVENVTR